MIAHVDLIVLSRDASPLSAEVAQGITAQTDVRFTVHRVFGRAESGDAHRWETIARARNAAKRLGRSEWVFFLDDDVVLAPGTVSQLFRMLQCRPEFGALAADYLHERRAGMPSGHVGMGATLFRRQALQKIMFRWKSGRCECQCCCDDLRRLGFGIEYHPTCGARHLKETDRAKHCRTEPGPCATDEKSRRFGYVLAAFDRFHFDKFCQQFFRSLRASGNRETVLAVAYGLLPSEQRELAGLDGVRALVLPRGHASVPVRRLQDFGRALAAIPPDAPAAYWDAGDVLFQGRLGKLWDEVQRYPDLLLVAPEPTLFTRNSAMVSWTQSIRSLEHRRRAWRLLSPRTVLNSGFAAGSAQVLSAYFAAADRLRNSIALHGTSDWGDQMALNLFCRTNPIRWRPADESWNYCLALRDLRQVRVSVAGKIQHQRGATIRVVHGNAGTLPLVAGAWRIPPALARALV